MQSENMIMSYILEESDSDSDNDSDIQYFYKQQDAIDHGKTKEEYLLFKYGMKKFATTKNNKSLLDIISKSNNPQFYEICDKSVKLFADIESYDCSHYEIIKEFRTLLSDIFKSLGKEFDKKKCIFLVDDSGKKSMHFIYDNGLTFDNNGERSGSSSKYSQWEFWNYVKHILFKNKDKYKKLNLWNEQGCSNGDKYSVESSAIDFAVYSKNRAMRIMHSFKSSNSKRVHYPVKLNHKKKKCILLKDIELSEKYLINGNSNNDEFKFGVPSVSKVKNKRHNITKIYDIIKEKLEDIIIYETKDNLISLKNNGSRTCLISGLVHGENGSKGNNCYVVIRKNGLYFQCHWDLCKDNPTDDISDIYDEDLGYCFHRFQNKLLNIKAKISNSSETNKDLVFDDMNRIISKLTIEKIEGEQEGEGYENYLTEESRELFISFLNQTIVYVTNAGKPHFYIKKKMFDVKTKHMRIDYVKRNVDIIYKNEDRLGFGCPKWNKKSKHAATVGSVIKFLNTMQNRNGDFIIKRYDNITFYPFWKTKIEIPHTFNMFQGWESEKYENKEISDMSYEDVKKKFEKSYAYQHISKNICNVENSDSEKLIDWTLKFIAHILQKPEEKPDICLVLYSKGGGGKDMFCSFIGNLIGQDYFAVFKSLNSFSSNFNVINKNKLLCVFNEVDAKSSHKNHDALKHIITQEYEFIEPKGVDADKFPCFKRYIINTNYRDIIKVEHDDRRYIFYSMNDKQVEDFEFFDKLFKEINNQKQLLLAFRYFTEMNISGYQPRRIPKTVYKRKQVNLNIKSSYQFLIALQKLEDTESNFGRQAWRYAIKEEKEEKNNEEDSDNEEEEIKEINDYHIKAGDFYKLYKTFCEEEDFRILRKGIFKEDISSMNLGDGKQLFTPKNREYTKRIRGYHIVNESLKNKLKRELTL